MSFHLNGMLACLLLLALVIQTTIPRASSSSPTPVSGISTLVDKLVLANIICACLVVSLSIILFILVHRQSTLRFSTLSSTISPPPSTPYQHAAGNYHTISETISTITTSPPILSTSPPPPPSLVDVYQDYATCIFMGRVHVTMVVAFMIGLGVCFATSVVTVIPGPPHGMASMLLLHCCLASYVGYFARKSYTFYQNKCETCGWCVTRSRC